MTTEALRRCWTAVNSSPLMLDYHDRDYFKGAVSGHPVSRQVVISRTNNLPGLIVAVPIKDSTEKVVGVLQAGTSLTTIAASSRSAMVSVRTPGSISVTPLDIARSEEDADRVEL